MEFYEKLQILRKEKKISQEQLAETLGVSRQAVSKWENGGSYPETDKLILMSDLFGVSIDILMKNDLDLQKQETTESEPKVSEIDTMSVGELAKTTAEKAFTQVKETSKKAINQSVDYTKNVAGSAYTKVKESSEKGWHATKDFIKNGKASAEQAIEESIDYTKTTASKMKERSKQNWDTTKNFVKSGRINTMSIIGSIISSALFLGATISVVVDYMIMGALTWSSVVTISCIFAMFIVLPPFHLKKNGLLVSLIFLTIFIYPFLLGLQYSITNFVMPYYGTIVNHFSPYFNWANVLGFPVSICWIAVIWAGYLLWKTNMPKRVYTLIMLVLVAVAQVFTTSVTCFYYPEELGLFHRIAIGNIVFEPISLILYLVLIGVAFLWVGIKQNIQEKESIEKPYSEGEQL